MQVFVPEKSYNESVKHVDSRRLNKQIIECNQIYKANVGISTGWKNHCVSRLWKSYEKELMYYAWCCYHELVQRGGNPSKPCVYDLDGVQVSYLSKLNQNINDPELLVGDVKPTHFMKLDWWVSAMRSHLLAKDLDYYSQFKWKEQPVSGYYAINKYGDWEKYSIKI